MFGYATYDDMWLIFIDFHRRLLKERRGVKGPDPPLSTLY